MVNEIINILDIKYQALYSWFKNYKRNDINDLYATKGKGRKALFQDINIYETKIIEVFDGFSFEQRSIVILDNASFHKSTGIKLI